MSYTDKLKALNVKDTSGSDMVATSNVTQHPPLPSLNTFLINVGIPFAGDPSPLSSVLTPSVSANIPDSQFHKKELAEFWLKQYKAIESMDAKQIREKALPLARIKKIMKSDEDVNMISSEVPILFAKACELFILELTLRAWFQTEVSRRRTLQRGDIIEAASSSDVFDFLIDIVPRNHQSNDARENSDEIKGRFWQEPSMLNQEEAASSSGEAIAKY